MNERNQIYQVAIVGAGPVGLFLACCLHHAGISCILLEKRAQPITHSRSIGIHPVSLNLFNKIGLADKFISAGTQVTEGLAFCNDEKVATLSFEYCPPPYPFILTLPQYKTERILAGHLTTIKPDILERGALVNRIEQVENNVRLSITQNGNLRSIKARFVVGCDGKNSYVRQAAAIPFSGKTYDDVYIMGDFSDNTSFGNSAAIFLCDDGLIESFPLAGNVRRWVVKTDYFIKNLSRDDIETRIFQRINHDLVDTGNMMLSSFGVQKKFAETMTKNRIILAGDAAHVISPIGGQGMNLGWLDAQALALRLKRIFAEGINPQKTLQMYSKQQLKIARKAARRAEFNMALGRKGSIYLKKIVLKGLLKTPASRLMARLFTMHGLRAYFL